MKSNLYKMLRTLVFTGGLVCVSIYAMTNAGGPPAENTGAPGDATCGQSGCHSFNPITAGTNWNNITFTSNIPSTGYVPGNTYSMTISHSQPGHSVFGFQATIQDANNVNAGSFASGTGSAVQSSNGKAYINHTSGGTSGVGGKSWTFSWTAPSSGTLGLLTMYVAINAANGDASNTGDTIFTKAFQIYQTGTAPPTVTYSSDKNTVCQNDTVQFTSNVSNGGSNPIYSWTIIGASYVAPSTANSANPKVVYTGTFAGTSVTRSVSLQVTNQNGTSSPVTQTILVNALPTATISPSGTVSICGNDSAALTAASGTNYTYLWTPGSSTNQTIYSKTAGSYSVKVTNSVTGCVKTSNTVTTVVRTIPTVTLASSKDSICAGDSVTFTATAGLTTYDFYRDTTKVQTGAGSTFKTAPGSSSLQYTVKAVDANGCKSNTSNALNINVQTPLAAPTVSCGTTTVNSIDFNWTSVSGADGYQVSIDSGKTWITPSSGATGLTHSVSGLAAATRVSLWARAIQASGKCATGNIGSTTCQTTGCTAVSFKLNYDSLVCNATTSDSATITISNASTSKYSVKVDQVTSTGTLIGNIYPYTGGSSFKVKLNGSSPVYYKFSMLDSVQVTCPAGTATANIRGIVSPAAIPTLTFGKTNNVLCDKEQATFTFSKPVGTNKYDFRKNNTSILITTSTTANFPSSTFANNDVLTVLAMDTTTGCSRSSASFTIVRKADPVAVFSFVKDSTSRKVTFTDETADATAWIWNFGDGSSNGNTKVSAHTYAANGTYPVSLVITTSDLCVSNAKLDTVRVNTGVLNLDGIGQVSIYPNPVKTNVIIDITKTTITDCEITVIDMNGRVVRTTADMVKTSQGYSLDMSTLERAVYMLTIKTANVSKTFQLIKE